MTAVLGNLRLGAFGPANEYLFTGVRSIVIFHCTYRSTKLPQFVGVQFPAYDTYLNQTPIWLFGTVASVSWTQNDKQHHNPTTPRHEKNNMDIHQRHQTVEVGEVDKYTWDMPVTAFHRADKWEETIKRSSEDTRGDLRKWRGEVNLEWMRTVDRRVRQEEDEAGVKVTKTDKDLYIFFKAKPCRRWGFGYWERGPFMNRSASIPISKIVGTPTIRVLTTKEYSQHRSLVSSTIHRAKHTYNLPFVTAAHSDTDPSDFLASAGQF